MAKRAIEAFDAEIAGNVVLELPRELAERIASAIESLKTKGDIDAALAELSELLKTAT